MQAMSMPIMMLLIFGVFWLLIIRPQAKKQKEHQEMLNKLGKGATVITRGGVIGTITGVAANNVVVLEIQEKVRVRVPRAYIENIWNEDKGENKGESKPTPRPPEVALSRGRRCRLSGLKRSFHGSHPPHAHDDLRRDPGVQRAVPVADRRR
jgi:preprotein translocase subunit YajC